jgi:hypothetical protein
MSFSNFNNSFPQGSQLQNCSAGSPIGGVDSSNIFRLLKLTAAGGIAQGVPGSTTGTTYFGINPVADITAAAPGLKAVNTIMARSLVIPTAISAGLYNIKPAYSQEQNPGGAVSIILTRLTSVLDNYASTLITGTDAFNPSAAQVANGLFGIWHNVSMQRFAGATALAVDNTFIDQTLYLEAGTYNLIVICHTAFTTTTQATLAGFEQFTQIA